MLEEGRYLNFFFKAHAVKERYWNAPRSVPSCLAARYLSMGTVISLRQLHPWTIAGITGGFLCERESGEAMRGLGRGSERFSFLQPQSPSGFAASSLARTEKCASYTGSWISVWALLGSYECHNSVIIFT